MLTQFEHIDALFRTSYLGDQKFAQGPWVELREAHPVTRPFSDESQDQSWLEHLHSKLLRFDLQWNLF